MKLYIILLLFSSFSFAQTALKVKEEFHSVEIFEKIIKEFNIDSKRKYMEVYEDSKELGLPPLSQLSQIYPEWEGWGKSSSKKTSDWVNQEVRKIQEDLNGFGGEEELEEKKGVQKKNLSSKRSSEKNKVAPYEELKKILIDQGVKSARDYQLLRKENEGVINGWSMPSEPNKKYKKWVSWGVFLEKLPMASYEELKKIARDQGVKTSMDYRLFRKENKGVFNGWRMPRNPHVHYGNKWENWGVFLGKKPSPPMASYEELKKISRDQGVKTSMDYRLFRKENKGVFNGWRMPSEPYIHYDEWEGWGVFLGKKPSLPFAPYEELKKILIAQGVKSARDYRLLRKENKGVFNGWRIPSEPYIHYGNKWENWRVFLGKPSLPFAPYEELKKILIDQGIKKSMEYFSWREKNKGVFNGWRMPSSPNTHYDEWRGWPKFFNDCELLFL